MTLEQVFCLVRTGQWTFSEFETWYYENVFSGEYQA
jgi:hypothetical protein